MNIHKNARLTPLRREEMAVAVLDGTLTKAQAACVYAVSRKIVRRWVERFRKGGRVAMTGRRGPGAVPGRPMPSCANALLPFVDNA